MQHNVAIDQADSSQPSRRVTVVGAGLAGTLMSILLDRAGCAVTLVDALKVYPKEFRAEQVVSEEELKRLGLLEAVVGNTPRVGEAFVYRLFWKWGVLARNAKSGHYGLSYDTMVNGARRHLPPSVNFIHERVEDISTSDDVQRITLKDGRIIESRLIVLATGLQSHLLPKLSMTRRTLSKEHSVAIGFDMTVDCHERFKSRVLTVYGNNWFGGARNGAVDYATFFLIGNSLRGNIFTNGKCTSDWIKRFRAAPIDTLLAYIPWLESETGKIGSIDGIRVRPNDVMIVENHRQHGVVCVGDTYLSPCPATGTGIARMLTEVGLLGNEFIPAWLQTPGMDAERIGTFYDDERKTGHDASALVDAMYHRGSTIGTGARWFTRRVKHAASEQWQRVSVWARRKAPQRFDARPVESVRQRL